MQRLLFLLLLWGCFFDSFAQTGAAIPTIEEVVRRFHDAYLIDNDEDGYITFEKRKDGWFVVSNRYEKNAFVPFKKSLFYDVEQKAYKDVGFAENKIPREFKIADYVDDWSRRYFDMHRYFGYRGWYKDVINELEPKKDLSDDELNSLARAYSTYSYNLFSDQGDNAINEEIWTLSYNINCFTDEQVKIYTRLSEKAQQYFKQLYDQNPAYETTVGNIRIKYANEVVVRFHILLAHSAKHASDIQLPNDLYPDSILQPLRKILADCPEESILMSFGDNDFYPVLYLQHKEKLREDVYLLNYNLLGVDRYIFRATKQQFRSPGIEMSLDTGYYHKRMNEVIYIEDSETAIRFADIRQKLKKLPADETERATVYGNLIQLRKDKKDEKAGTINLPVNKQRYMLKNHWALFDIIENLGARKLCTAAYFQDPLLEGINDYFKQNNNVWVLQL